MVAATVNEPQEGRLRLGRGGFHGGQPHMLDGFNPDGSTRPGGDEFLPEANHQPP